MPKPMKEHKSRVMFAWRAKARMKKKQKPNGYKLIFDALIFDALAGSEKEVIIRKTAALKRGDGANRVRPEEQPTLVQKPFPLQRDFMRRMKKRQREEMQQQPQQGSEV